VLCHCLQTSEVNKKDSEEIGLPGNSEKNDETILQGSCMHLSALEIRIVNGYSLPKYSEI
jgi:hypothetical protein